MNSNFSNSELLYLVIDGEANADEKRAAFSALAHDEALQEEFYDALQMRSVAFNDAGSMTPPAYIGQNFLKAAGVSTLLGTVSQSPFVLGLLKMLPPFLGFAIGTILTVFIMKWSGNDTASSQYSTGVTASESKKTAQVTPVLSDDKELFSSLTPPKVITRYVYLPAEKSVPPSFQPTSAASEAPRSYQQEKVVTTVVNSAPNTTQVPTINQKPEHNDANQLAPVADSAHDIILENKEFTFLVQASGIRDLSINSANITTAQYQPLNNLAGAVFYRLSNNSAVGIALGHEDLPLYVQRNNQEFTPRQTVFWVGGAFRYSLGSMVSFADIRPFIQPTLAATQVGPLAKTTVGINWMPDARVSLHVGAEALGLMFKNENNQYQVVSKFGFSYGLSILF